MRLVSIRRTGYWLRQASCLRSWLDWLGFAATRRFLIRQCKVGQVGPIVLSSTSFRMDPDRDAAFAAVTVAALALIQCYDPRHFRLIEREVHLIVNQELVSGAAYDHRIRQCKIDFARYWTDKEGRVRADPQREDYEWYLARYASTLVHEATHARLESLHFAYTKSTRARIERICVQEQRRFLARLPRDRYDFTELVSPFNEARWQSLWRLRGLRRTKTLHQRIRDARQS